MLSGGMNVTGIGFFGLNASCWLACLLHHEHSGKSPNNFLLVCCRRGGTNLSDKLQLLTHKPLTYAANVSEDDISDAGASNAQVKALKEKAVEENCEVVVVSAQVRLANSFYTPTTCHCGLLSCASFRWLPQGFRAWNGLYNTYALAPSKLC